MSGSNESPDICGRCGGVCCRTLPGFDSPEKMLSSSDPEEFILSLIESGGWVLSPHPWRTESEEWITVYYPRPRGSEDDSAGIISAEGGVCVFLNEEGCALTFEGRPKLCRELTPSAEYECVSNWSKFDAAREWLPFQHHILNALKRTSNKGKW